ncbi:conserved hypothetical protein [Altererythrobacter sp. B11]|uniref:DUF2231 domain-containing protein n=1 Tax=Altererythrobacter sp. B11 TaxID=2060312 RepID=UPI000DC71922|nr:DUF2231 domain-containing protein [Altererythrobacter sp. B11]BBC71682.1 conserved hypothetical protein [Altererythrobacter sp. B11]
MPPVHPALVHYPVALGVTSVIADTVAAVAGFPQLFVVGQWAMAIAAAGAAVAAPAGYWDMKRDDLAHETHELVHLHMKSGLTLVVALVIGAIWRWSLDSPAVTYLLFAWIVLGGLTLQTWMGGEIVYVHGGGVAAAGQGTAPEAEAKRPSRMLYRRLSGEREGSGSGE